MKWTTAVAPVLTSALLGACGSRAIEPQVAESRPLSVKTETARELPVAITYWASGTVRGRNTAILTSKTMGYIRAVRVRSGDRISEGQTLVDLEANDVRASVLRANAALTNAADTKLEAESALEGASARAKAAKLAYDRSVRLLESQAITKEQYDESEAAWRTSASQERMAQARVRSLASSIDEARASLGQAQATLGYASIVAPFAGQVLERHVDPGSLASPGTVLLVVADEGQSHIEVSVEESHSGQIHVGDHVQIAIDALRHPIAGVVSEIVPTVDTSARAFAVKIELPSEVPHLPMGTFARVGFAIGSRPRLVVPLSSISILGSLERVFVVDGGHVHLRMITQGESHDGLTEILSGLSANEDVVVSPSAELRDGSPIEAP